MKINLKIIIVLVLMLGAAVWAVDSVRSRSYNATPLTFNVGHGTVSVTNPSDASVSAQIVGTGSRSFTVTNMADGVSGPSTREGTGRTTTQLFPVTLLPGANVFTVAGGTGVTFNADTETPLEATVQPLDQNETRSTLIVVAVVILLGLFYISRTTGHRWMRSARSIKAAEEAAAAKVLADKTEEPSQGRTMRSYGDNRA
jgi:preprotein translocase subunit SecE